MHARIEYSSLVVVNSVQRATGERESMSGTTRMDSKHDRCSYETREKEGIPRDDISTDGAGGRNTLVELGNNGTGVVMPR